MVDLPPEWQVVLEAVGWIGSGIVVWSMLQQRILRLRLHNLVGLPHPGALQRRARGVAGCGAQRRPRARPGGQSHPPAAGAGRPGGLRRGRGAADGPLLGRFLDRHRADVARSHPDFAQPSRDAEAYVVMSGDELVGAVVVHDDGDGLAQMELDYVTEKYRDFSPGQFVFRGSGVLAERGYRAVAAPPDIVEPYYEQVGFERRGDRYVLERQPTA